MPSPLDWLGVAPAPQTSLMTPAVSPYRSYGLTSADAVRQGNQALGNLQAAASYADLLRQQALAPLQQQVAQNQLQNQLETQPRIAEGRDVLVQPISALDPTSDDYLARRRDAVMLNPYGLVDPIVQEVLRANDRAYDDYISMKRLSAYGVPRALTLSQQASIQHQMSRVTESLGKAQAIGDAAMVSRYTQELQSLGALLSGAAAPAAATAPTAEASLNEQPANPSKALGTLPENERWSKAKEMLLAAATKEASSLGSTREAIIAAVASDEDMAKDFFGRYFNSGPRETVFKSPSTRPWYTGNWDSEVPWRDIVKSLQDDTEMLGVGQRAARGEAPINVESEAAQGFPTGTWRIQRVK